MEDTLSLKNSFLKESKSATSVAKLQQLRIKYLGKKGLITSKLKALSTISPELRPAYGKVVNEVKVYIEEEINRIESLLKKEEHKKRIVSEAVDITLPGKFTPFGREHPINKVLSEITVIFVSMGFEVEEGPDVELDYYNFEALNMPKDHPAREMQDTFYISEDIVLRTHTSPVQIRVMEKRKPPLKIIAPGKVYRCDADISHTPMFHQVEGFMVDTDVAFSDLKGLLESFIHSFFSAETPVRFRPSFFPFTEPSAEVDIGCIFCSGKGCRVCKNTGWLEILGAGMINPRVFEMVGYNPEIYSGFAFGMGIERMAMLKYSIDDIRLFFENDMRFLKQF
ncbi:MAG: phenylalanine--tRNA ligase subunit alpha [Nitrospirae bacterium CG_4_10_14_0_8_um_filter_41_23]|nr:phenylalanine--tRNA ligase subunit alpha [Nitrospirota bacterium]OIP60514.1 MAG: phenylalanine--tRNA ligase subunit alpha [Nitrospirae bacterium CG2_30_41_42]PIQ94513.1 MAG: phenylalanine--tRNA ligase subunit alpha [Nitrospirae bacterium CG11_big_fil_rev_8_21_14_0_20_41_14]PIV42904.1 MAG: phenylalanine--tRNA ligase subunit alpha [Nitrospirae bacterium CG02_land_8_20_14_3_00_41_53]PIW87785.1 MAG: phenylalanine--tRNA ligase subunit alpha [Nitrospirae bacterium CG_4_8_14_3_um_filter_41_47]PIY8